MTTAQQTTGKTVDQLRDECRDLIAARDLRFYTDDNISVVLANRTAGEIVRAHTTPLLDEAGAEALAAAMLEHVVPAMDSHALLHLKHCLRFCPPKTPLK